MDPEQLTDPFQNYITRYPQPLDAIFLPKSVAVIGAKDTIGSVGRTIMLNLLSGTFKGKVYPINPKRSEVLGTPAYPTLASLPEKVDLAVIVTPAPTVPGIVAECVAAGIPAAIIISAGFKELGPPGLALEEEILRIARKGKMRIIGPNCLGVMNPLHGLNATFAKGMALPGQIAFISQSGAMCTAVLDWSLQERIGFSAFVSIGSMADVDWGDLIAYLGGDPNTHSLLMYMETIGNPRNFLSAAREIALEKPIIVIKPGRSQEAASAAASHTGSLSGSDEVFEAAMERAGVLRVNNISELFHMASVLGRQPKPRGPRLSIVTNAGGPSVLATDAAMIHGATLAKLEPQTIEKLNAFLPSAWSHSNPVDILGDADPQRYEKTLEVLTKDPNVDGVLVVLSPQDMTDPVGTAEGLRPFAHLKDKPLLASWMGGAYVRTGIDILNRSGIPSFEYPDDAAWSFATMWRYSRNLQSLYETPLIMEGEELDDRTPRHQAGEIIQRAYDENRELLTEFESKQLLKAYEIPIIETLTAFSADEAVSKAQNIGYPVVVKLLSNTITHKTDVGGVKLNLKSDEEVKAAFESIYDAVVTKHTAADFQGVTVQKMAKLEGFELILGASLDPQFGPVILFGTGGIMVEIYKDSALALPPLNTTLAKRLIEQTKISHALTGFRGKPSVDMDALLKLVVNFSHLVVENRQIMECDINPLLVSHEGLYALDARIVLHPKNLPKDQIPKLAIRPYPIRYIKQEKLRDGTPITLRPIRPEDEQNMITFHKSLSESTVRQRYFEFVSLDERIAHERLVRICFNDFDRDIALVAELTDSSKKSVIAAVARLSRQGEDSAALTMTVSDAYQNKGIGTDLLQHLLHVAKEEKINRITATLLAENTGMIHLCHKAGFNLTEAPPLVHANLLLAQGGIS